MHSNETFEYDDFSDKDYIVVIKQMDVDYIDFTINFTDPQSWSKGEYTDVFTVYVDFQDIDPSFDSDKYEIG